MDIDKEVWLALIALGQKFVENGPKILESLGIVLTAAGTLWGVLRTGRVAKIAQQSVDETKAGNAKIDAVHEAVKQAPAVAVTVEAPPPPTPPAGTEP